MVIRESTASEYNIPDVYTLIVQGIRAIINQLSDQKQRIINGRSGTVDGRYNTFIQLLKEPHVTYERVRQLQEKAIRRILSEKSFVIKGKMEGHKNP
jgi:DNA-directed RNA polymerase sigma subunit (sigma70/sigma32)